MTDDEMKELKVLLKKLRDQDCEQEKHLKEMKTSIFIYVILILQTLASLSISYVNMFWPSKIMLYGWSMLLFNLSLFIVLCILIRK